MGLLRDSVGMSMAPVPVQIDPAKVRSFIETRDVVARVHDQHIWPMSTAKITAGIQPRGRHAAPGSAEAAHTFLDRELVSHRVANVAISPLAAPTSPPNIPKSVRLIATNTPTPRPGAKAR